MKRGRLVSVLFSLLLLGGVVAASLNVQNILDWWALRDYTPSARVVQLADQTTMQDTTRRVFYANHPELDDKSVFRNRCQVAEQSIVLGCYVQRQGIFLLDVTDPRLDGVIQVTAAHETLHAQYDRLSSSERQKVDAMTAAFFSTLQNDRIKKTIEQYHAKDPGVVPNELHSILGSEVRELSPELKRYYSRYFIDRQKIVAFSEQYEQTFVSLKDQVKSYDARLQDLKASIEANESNIEALGKQLEEQRHEMNQLLDNDKAEAYNQRVASFNDLVNQYNAQVSTAKNLIAQYNSIVEKRNAVATTEQELAQAIDSNSLPAQQKP